LSQSPAPLAVPKASPVTMDVHLTSGNYTLLGAGLIKEEDKPNPPGPDFETETLAINIVNRSRAELEKIEVRYTLFKQTTGGNEDGQTPVKFADGKKTITLKPGGSQTVIGYGYLRVPSQPGGMRSMVAVRGVSPLGASVACDVVYGYIVEVYQKCEKIAETFNPPSLRNQRRPK
jgi:hypothetical protein